MVLSPSSDAAVLTHQTFLWRCLRWSKVLKLLQVLHATTRATRWRLGWVHHWPKNKPFYSVVDHSAWFCKHYLIKHRDLLSVQREENTRLWELILRFDALNSLKKEFYFAEPTTRNFSGLRGSWHTDRLILSPQVKIRKCVVRWSGRVHTMTACCTSCWLCSPMFFRIWLAALRRALLADFEATVSG